jgi:hypothetical protein
MAGKCQGGGSMHTAQLARHGARARVHIALVALMVATAIESAPKCNKCCSLQQFLAGLRPGITPKRVQDTLSGWLIEYQHLLLMWCP